MKNKAPSLIAAIVLAGIAPIAAAGDFASHTPQRPLPIANQRALPAGVVRVADATRGDDANAGTEAAPWRTLDHAVAQMPRGGVLCLRGVFYSHTIIRTTATAGQPLVIRSWPGELAVIDGGDADFALQPEKAWEPCPDGVPGEFRSTKPHALAKTAGEQDGDGQVLVMGRFMDSMIPLHGARFHGDLQSDNPWWNIEKSTAQTFVYCGPAVWQDGKTGRIHCRLAHTKLPGLGEDNYTGITDARKTPLCIATVASGPALTLQNARHITLQDLVVRGSATATLLIEECADIALDGVTIYGGGKAMQVRDTAGLRMIHSACRGLSAPWMYRGALKYRSVEARLLSATSWMPSGVDNRDFEIAYCEFTDCEDGVFIGSVRGVRFHHNLVENMTDDGVFLTAVSGYDGHVAGGDVRLWQNRFSRCLTTFAFGVGHGRQITLPDRVQTGDGVWITRNVFDFRRPVHYHWPKNADDPQAPSFRGRFGGDHGSPVWEPMWVYHNTIIGGEVLRPDFGNPGLGAGMGKGNTRHVLNNILCVDIGKPGAALPKDSTQFTAQGNALWSFDSNAPKAAAPAGNQVADPNFKSYSANWRDDVDLTPRTGIAGAEVPAAWFDPLRAKDIGALPANAEPWRIGVHGRMDVFGRNATTTTALPGFAWSFANDHSTHGPRADAPRALSIRGYPAFDAPILEYLLRRRGVVVEFRDREHVPLTAAALAGRKLLLYDGSLTRAKVEPNTLGDADIAALEKWLTDGGTLILCRDRKDIFNSEPGRAFLVRHFGAPVKGKPAADTITTTRIGNGSIIVLGGSVGSKLTDNRRGSTAEADAAMLAQVRILGDMLDAALGRKPAN